MKKVMMVLLMAFMGFAAGAQLVHTTWKGNIKGDAAQACTINFGKDTAVLYGSNGNIIETMKYIVNPKTLILTLTKIAGQSDCNTAGAGKYKMTGVVSSFTLLLVTDDCGDRSGALNNTAWAKQRKGGK